MWSDTHYELFLTPEPLSLQHLFLPCFKVSFSFWVENNKVYLQQEISSLIILNSKFVGFESRTTVCYKKALVLSDSTSAGVLTCMHSECYTTISHSLQNLEWSPTHE
jgi:hypothetical protein